MSFPTAVFLDTSILVGQQYNFDSAALKAFVEVASKRGLTLLLPDPTRKEVTRQIGERSIEALRALENARRRAPFLAKWKAFPKLPESRFADWEVKRVASQEWEAFLKRFTVKELGYEGVNLGTVMGWYESIRPPFGEGKKRKEFPDAFAIAALEAHASSTNTYVAVVSEDHDFRAACDRFPRLLYFATLPALTELLLGDEQPVEKARNLILADTQLLVRAILEEASVLDIYHENDRYEEIGDVEFDDASVDEVHIVALGSGSCTVAFAGNLELSARLVWKDPDPYGFDDRESARVYDSSHISGTAKVSLTADRTAAESVTFIEFDQGGIELTSEP